MIGKVMRGSDVGGLLRVLYGPGQTNEHVDPHLVAAWDEPAHDHEPAWVTGAKRDVRPWPTCWSSQSPLQLPGRASPSGIAPCASPLVTAD